MDAAPNFFVIGAYKSGTTAVYDYLRQHPKVFLPDLKEPNYFAFAKGRSARPMPPSTIVDQDQYLALYAEATHEIAVGDVSPEYMTSPQAAENIYRQRPDARLIAILRNPVDRAWSDYLMYVRDGVEQLDFLEALRAQDARAAAGDPTGFYVETGYYFRQLKPYFERFEQEQIRVYLYEDLQANPIETTQDMFRFLGVDESFIPSVSYRPNVSGIPTNTLAQALFRARARLAPALAPVIPRTIRALIDPMMARMLRKPTMPRQGADWLKRAYRGEIADLQELIQRDLSHWL